MVSNAVVKEVGFGFFGGERNEGEVTIHVGLGEGEDFHLPSIVVKVTHEGAKNVNGGVIAKGITFKVKSHIPSFGDEFETFLHLANDGFSVSHCHNESSFPPKQG